MRAGRVLRMSVPEIAARGRREGVKLMERAGSLRRIPPRGRRWEGDAVAAGAALWERFRAQAPGRFFPGAGDPRLPAALEAIDPGAGAALQAAADRLLAGRFDLLGYDGLQFGEPIDWHLDAVSGRRAPRIHWSRIRPLDRDRVGDSKVIWELNRHQWLVRLAQAYRMTGDARCARRVAVVLRQWLEANPPGIGINWASSLEAALRIIAWTWTLVLLRDSDAIEPLLFADLTAAVRDHAAHVERHLSVWYSPNTHLTGEALGLFYAGTVWSDFKEAPRWRELGARTLIRESGRQILPDGVHFEQSTCYQRYTAEIYLHFAILAARHDLPLPEPMVRRLHLLLEALLALRRPDGTLPAIGDADGGWLLPLTSRAPGDARGVFSVAAACLDRADFAWAAGAPAPEALWCLGTDAVGPRPAGAPAPPESGPSRLLPAGGYAVLRSGWDDRAHQLQLDTGPIGCPISAGHGHADLLGIECVVFGEPYLVDPGTGCYTADPGWRDHFRGTGAHNTVLIDGRGQADPDGPFAWRSRPRARLRGCVFGPTLECADAEHDAYLRLPDPVVHRRRVVFIRPDYWIVVDDLHGDDEHRIELRFQFAPLPVAFEPSGWARARGRYSGGLLVRPFARIPLHGYRLEGETSPRAGWVSPDYGRRQPAPLLLYRTLARLPIRIATVLMPIPDADAEAPPVHPLPGAGADPGALAIDRGGGVRDIVRFERDEVALERA